MKDLIYFDNNATTQPLSEVVDAMLPILRDGYANPSSVHQFGQWARHKIECARQPVARLIGATPREIIFTSGGTESINLALRGVLPKEGTRRHIVTTTVEHSAVLRVVEALEARGYAVDRVGVDREGRIDEAQWEAKITDETALVTLQHVNNETGVVWDVARLASVAAARGAIVHVDAMQSVGKLPIDVAQWPVQLVSMSAHKFHGPKGVGALYVRRRTRVQPIMLGGSQERTLRGGTENVAGIVGMGVAAELALKDRENVARSVGAMRDLLESGIEQAVSFAHVSSRQTQRVYNTSNIAFEGLEAEAILLLLSEAGICASSGAACSSGSLEPSHVLKAMGIQERIAHGAIRFSLSKFNTPDQVRSVVSILPALLAKLTSLAGRS